VSIYAAAVASETRPEADRDSDAGRKPEAVLEFFGIQPGDVVLEMWAGQNAKVVPALVPNSGSSTVTPGKLRC